jgi:non-ribosomal peptide synthase protein (TIGR01720 family)
VEQAARARPVPLPLDHPAGCNTRTSAESVWVTLTADETRALLQQAAPAYQAPVNELLLAALARAFARWTGRAGLLLDLEGHGRDGVLPDEDLTRTVGWIAAIYPAWLEVPADATDERAVRSVREQLAGVPRHGIGYGVLRYLGGQPEIAARLRSAFQAQVCFNYVGQFDSLPLAAALAPAHRSTGHVHSVQGLRRYVLEFNGHVAEGRLEAGFTYSTQLHERATVERLAQDFAAALRSLIGSPASRET